MLARDLHIAEEFPDLPIDRWRELVEADLVGSSPATGDPKALFERKLVSHTYEGLYVQPLYTERDWPSASRVTGSSGVAPWIRGSSALGNVQNGWDIRQEHAAADPVELNANLLEDLHGGVTSVLLRLDAAGRSGCDADEPHVRNIVAIDGCSLSSPPDWDAAFKGVHLGMIGVSLQAGAAFVPAAAQLMALWERSRVSPDTARGAFHADPLAVLVRDGQVPVPVEGLLHQMADLASFTASRYPKVTSIRVGTAPYHHAGATATQDLAFSMATGVEYLRALTRAGLSVDAASNQMVFSFAVGCQFFLATAKLRAARRLWGRIVECSGGSPHAQSMHMHVRPSKRVMAHRDPWVNILRNTACVFAAGIAGAESIGSEPFDCVLGSPSELARRIARNTHHMLMDEAHLHQISDPAGGSWYLEKLTDELAEAAWIIFQDIERRGGMLACLRSGWVHPQIDTSYASRVHNISTRKDPVLGVSEFANPLEQRPTPRVVDLDAVRAAGMRRVLAHRSSRNAVPRSIDRSGQLGSLSRTALDAALAGATIGEIARSLWNGAPAQTLESGPLAAHPYAEPFEHLRDQADAIAAECGHRPSVQLLTLGTIAEHGARVAYARNFFQAGGFAVRTIDRPSDAHQGGIVVVCGHDTQYSNGLAEQAARELSAAGARTIVLAGIPGTAERESAYRSAGIDRFIFVKCDVVRTLSELLSEEGAAR
ncbi:MAG: acyl-CoA mutase large subunit family protein [Phycisphaerales bacterium]|nr:acyl-CoA mutase large subunit family protein [Phycisphaerales bacterium]